MPRWLPLALGVAPKEARTIADPTARRRSPATDVAAVLSVEWWFVRRSLLYGRLGVFAVAAVLSGLVLYAWFAFYHYTFSSYSASADVLLSVLGGGPSSDASRVGDGILWLLVPSIVLLGFDVRARDELARIDGPLDARPMTNLALIIGRLAALVLSHWVLLAGALLLCHLVGFHPWRDAVQGPLQALAALAPFSGRSLLLFLFADALPALLLWGALVFLLASVLRNRAAVLAIGFALIGAYWAALVYAPPGLLPVLGVPVAQTALQSDLAATTPGVMVGLQRVFLLVFVGGCVALAAVWHPRRDDGRGRLLAVGTALVVGAAIGLLTLALWTAAAEPPNPMSPAEREQSALLPADALKKLTAFVEIEPGESLALNLEMQVVVPPRPDGRDGPDGKAALSLNPGLRVQELRVDGVSRPFERAGGLLTFALSSPDAKQVALSLIAAGRPSGRFGYARNRPSDVLLSSESPAPAPTEARLAWRWHSAWSPLDALGSERAIFDTRYVALMPESGWLPAFADGPSYFELDLTVDLPSGWLAAAPGQREPVPGASDGRERFRFAPATPVSELGLFAARFESRQVQAGDVRLEALFSPKAQRNFALFGDVADELAGRAGAVFEDLANLGLPYPYRALTVVEVPRTLRTYDSGWRMGSVQSLPGILLLREGAFPTARFEFALRWLGFRLGYRQDSRARFKAADLPAAKLDLLELYFGNDVTGGNPWQGAARQWFGLRTWASGEAALALDFLAQALALRLLTDRPAYFSAHSLARQGSLGAAPDMFASLLSSTEQTVGAAVFAIETGHPAVWERLLDKPLTELGPDDPGTVLRAHTLKADAVARIVLELFGREPVARLLARLLARHEGSTFEEADFKAALAAAGMQDATALVDHYLHESALAGFATTPLAIRRLPRDAAGRPRYQALVHVHNGEPVKGYLRLSYTLEEDDPYQVHSGELVELNGHSAKEVGLVTPSPPASVVIEPFLALNRGPIPLGVPASDSYAPADYSEPLAGSRPSSWRPASEAGIVVDDLDAGFSIKAFADGLPWWESSRRWLRRTLPADWLRSAEALDQGIPQFNAGASPANAWMRDELPFAYGRYRHTVARAVAGSGHFLAVFEASLPVAGQWRLDYHMPPEAETGQRLQANGRPRLDPGRLRAQGRYEMRLDAASQSREVTFDGAEATPGWNRIGAWDLEAGTVRLGVSTKTNGAVVVADAIRWSLEAEGL